MVSEKLLGRRLFLRATGVTATGALLAGCGDGGGGGGDEDGGMDETETEPQDGGTEENETEAGNETGGGGAASEVDEYLSDTSNYDGVVDETGSDSVTVQVGAEGNDGNFAFEPAAGQVSSGTEVVWEWTGQGGSHNVVHEEGTFESELQDQEGATFSHTFEETGNFLYYCDPHRDLGMKGAIIVEE
jgi:halocyanin-like protein